MEHRIIELETRLAFQEITLEELNSALIDQQAQLDRLEKECTRLTNLLAASHASPETDRP